MRKQVVSTVKNIFLFFGYRIERFFPEKDIFLPLHIKLNIFFDVGASVGNYVEQIRKQGYSGKVVSFEPTAGAYLKLMERSSRDSNWSVYDRCALGNTNGIVNINVSLNSFSSSILPILELHLKAAPDSKYVNQETVPILRLSDVWASQFSQFNKIGIKIDVQGFELDVLKGAIEIIDFIEFIQIEMSLVEVYSGQSLYTDVDLFLRSHGFRLWKILAGFTDPQTGQLIQFDGIYIRKF
jgi:FkbM family methyltransferase